MEALKTSLTLLIENKRNHASDEGATPLHRRKLVQALGPNYFSMPLKTPRYRKRIIGEGGKEFFRRNTPKRGPKKAKHAAEVKTPLYYRRIIGDGGKESFRRNTPKRKPKKDKLVGGQSPKEASAPAEGEGIYTLLKISLSC